MDNPIKSIRKFSDLKVWNDAHLITVEIYRLTKTFPHNEEFAVTSQIRRSSSSIGANIAEGFGRFHYKDKIRFYLNARGSALELQNHLYLAKDIEYISVSDCENLLTRIEEVIKEINGLIKSMNKNLN